MKLQTSICSNCKHFEHECGIGTDDQCTEHCFHKDADIIDMFYEKDEIHDCKGFETE